MRSILLSSREQSALGQHNEGTDAFIVRLELHPDEVGSVSVDGVDGDEAVAVSRHDIAVLLELYTGHVCAGRLKRKTRVSLFSRRIKRFREILRAL